MKNKIKEKIGDFKDKINDWIIMIILMYIIVIINMVCISATVIMVYGPTSITKQFIIVAHGFAWLAFGIQVFLTIIAYQIGGW